MKVVHGVLRLSGDLYEIYKTLSRLQNTRSPERENVVMNLQYALEKQYRENTVFISRYKNELLILNALCIYVFIKEEIAF